MNLTNSSINKLLWLTTCWCMVAMCNDTKAASVALEDVAVPDEGQNESVLCPNMAKYGCVNIHLCEWAPAHVHNFTMTELHDEWDIHYNEMYNNMYAGDYTFGAKTAYACAAFLHKHIFSGFFNWVFCIWPQRFGKAVIPTFFYFICIN